MKRMIMSAAALALIAPAQVSEAQSLQNCTPGPMNTTGQLPIGVFGEDGYTYRSLLYDQLLAPTTAADVTYPTGWLSPDTPYFAKAATVPMGLYDYVRATQTLTNPHQNNLLVTGPIFWQDCVTHWMGSQLPLTDQDKQMLEQLWILMALDYPDLGADVIQLFHHPPGIYTLAQIEEKTTCTARVPITKLYNFMWWFTRWQYPGNSMSSPAIADAMARRTAVGLALGLILLDSHLFNRVYPSAQPPLPGETFVHPALTTLGMYVAPVGTVDSAVVSDYVLNLARQYEYLHGITPAPLWLTSTIDGAMAEGVARATERLARMRMAFGQMNRYFQAAQATAAAKRALAGTTWSATATAAHDLAVDKVLATFDPLGFYPDDDGALDIAYNQNNLNHTVNLLLSDPGTGTRAADLAAHARAIDELEAHLIVTDRTSHHYSPSAMSVRTGGGLSLTTVVTSPAHVVPRIAGSELTLGNALTLPFAHARARDLKDMSDYNPNSPTVGAMMDARTTNPRFHAELMCTQHPNHDVWTMTPLVPPTVADLDQHVWNYKRPEYGLELHTVDTNGSSVLRRHADILDAQPSSRLLPFEMAGPYLRSFQDQFVFAKFGGEGVYFEGRPDLFTTNEYQLATPGDYAAILHVGPVTSTARAGFGGGQIAALWAPGGGVFSLNRRKGRNNTGSIDSWANNEWASLPVHAVTLIDDTAKWVSSTRVLTPTVTTHFVDGGASTLPAAFLTSGNHALSGVPAELPEDADSVFVEVHGNLPDEHVLIDNTDAFSYAPVYSWYRRRFAVTGDAIRVRTDLYPTPFGQPVQLNDEGEPIDDLAGPRVLQAWETIPLWFAAGQTGTGTVQSDVTFVDEDGAMYAASQSSSWLSYANIVQVIVTRENGTMQIDFDAPQTLGLSPAWTGLPSRNLMIDLTPNHVSWSNAIGPMQQVVDLETVSVRYTITFVSI